MTTLYDAHAALGFLIGQTSHIEQQVNEIVYPDIQYPQLIPVDTSAGEYSQSVTYFSSDKYGKASWINGNADDVPLAGTDHTKFQTPVFTAAIGYSFGFEEVGVAMSLGRNLQADDAAAARRAYEEFVDGVALFGDAAKGFSGLVNNSAVNAASATNGDWGGTGTTSDQVLEDVNNAILAVGSSTLYTSIADTLLLSFGKMNFLATTRLGDTERTLLSFLRENNTYTATTGRPLTIRGVRGLETAGANSTERMIAYRRDPSVLKLHVPMVHRFLPVHQAGPLRWEVPGVFRLGGLDIRRPLEVKYRDGI